jgi:hypothetical protein
MLLIDFWVLGVVCNTIVQGARGEAADAGGGGRAYPAPRATPAFQIYQDDCETR